MQTLLLNPECGSRVVCVVTTRVAVVFRGATTAVPVGETVQQYTVPGNNSSQYRSTTMLCQSTAQKGAGVQEMFCASHALMYSSTCERQVALGSTGFGVSLIIQ